MHNPLPMPVSTAHSKLVYDALKECGIGLLAAFLETWLVPLISLAEGSIPERRR